MKTHLAYLAIILILISGMFFMGNKIHQLEGLNRDWDIAYQKVTQSWNAESLQWIAEREQWQEAVANRDAVFEWHKAQPPKVETVTEVKEVEVVKEVLREVEKVVYEQARNPASLQELRQFLADDDNSLIANADGVISLVGCCEDFALSLQARAQGLGIKLDTEGLTKAECIQYRDFIVDADLSQMKWNDGHMICKAIIGNEVWYIEPQNDKVWLAYYLD